MSVKINYNDNDFIIDGLGGTGYSHRVYKKIVPSYKFIRGQFQIGIIKK